MELVRIDSTKDINREFIRLSFKHNGEKYTITPEITGFRIHKHSLDDGLIIIPGCNNEIIVK